MLTPECQPLNAHPSVPTPKRERRARPLTADQLGLVYDDVAEILQVHHPAVELKANLNSISHRCHLFEVASVWESTTETIYLPPGCLQGGGGTSKANAGRAR